MTNLIYIAQLTHCSACVKDLNEQPSWAALPNNNYKATALRSFQLRFAFLFIFPFTSSQTLEYIFPKVRYHFG